MLQGWYATVINAIRNTPFSHHYLGSMYSNTVAIIGPSPTVFITTYSSVIISFIAGRLWGLSLKIDGMSPSFLFLTSNLITLIAWTTVLFLSIKLILIAHMILYILLLNIDRWLYRQQVIESYQLNERIMATVLVVIMLGMMILLV